MEIYNLSAFTCVSKNILIELELAISSAPPLFFLGFQVRSLQLESRKNKAYWVGEYLMKDPNPNNLVE